MSRITGTSGMAGTADGARAPARFRLAGWACLLLIAVSPSLAPVPGRQQSAGVRHAAAGQDREARRAAGLRSPEAPAQSRVALSQHPPRLTGSGLQTRSAAAGLARTLRDLAQDQAGPAWAGYAAPVVEGRHQMCCFDSLEGLKSSPGLCGHCDLEEEKGITINSFDSRKVDLESSDRFFVVFRLSRGQVQKIRVFSETCELNTGRLPFHWLTDVDPEESLEWLSSFVSRRERRSGEDDDRDADSDEDLSEQALTAIAMHAGAGADRRLETFASRGQPRDLREHAAFWLGNQRGRAGYDVLRRILRDESDAGFHQEVIFPLSQSSVPEALDLLMAAARDDKDPDVRGQALFWLAQKAGEKAAGAITGAIENDPETDVKKKAVFALSQLPPEEGVPLLIQVARTHRNPAVRKEAIFWLGQSQDPRALDFIEKILNS